MNTLLKASCLAIYLLAIIGVFVALPLDAAKPIQYAAAFLLIGHAVELALFFKHVKRYPGPLLSSIALTLLFGFLHWLPLARAAGAGKISRAAE